MRDCTPDLHVVERINKLEAITNDKTPSIINQKQRAMKEVFTRLQPEKLQEIRDELLSGKPVRVINEFETFYGCSFDRWLRNGIKDIPCDIKVISYNHFPDCGYPWEYEITPK